MRVTYIFLVVLGSHIREACSLSCGNGAIVDILPGQRNFLTCPAKEVEEWRLGVDNNTLILIALWENNKFNLINDFQETFGISSITDQQSPVWVYIANNTKINKSFLILNSTLWCGKGSTFCRLNYVYPAEGVSCTTVTSQWNALVTCKIRSAYSSRRTYTCQLILVEQGSANLSLETVPMVTTSTNELVTKKEVKVSGYCLFHTNLSTQTGHYAYYVNISPGGRCYKANIAEYNTEWITVELPSLPKMACYPSSYVLENTNISCTCSTTSLGQPAGYLTWYVGRYNHNNLENLIRADRRDDKPTEIHYSQTLTLTDHNTTWFRCDVLWGRDRYRGENYTAKVGYLPRQPQLLVNNYNRNLTVVEGEEVSLRCTSDGRPATFLTLVNTGREMAKGSSVIQSVFIARCEHGGVYTCSTENLFLPEHLLTTSLYLHVKCKPRSLSSDDIIELRNNQFEVIAYPMPRNISIVHVGGKPGTCTTSVDDEASVMLQPCTPHPHLPYIFTCTLPSNIPLSTEITPGCYRVVVANDIGTGNFTLVLNDGK